ncbi:FkbM family methyltransferase [Bdellovibrio sp. HCB2-146]|uniref:FkbM family methyltransferase n=1 Tax=Bdellovibrio sp. HCB2-146 TaxID=3394362 RepID=UPI0039BD50F9
MRLKTKILRTLSPFFPWLEIYKNRNNSFAQEGEDLLILEAMKYKRNGFFVDVGAHHPFRFSNTYALKSYGWTGINIEPNPTLYQYFCKLRPDDINLNCGISNATSNSLTYYEFDEPALNTFSKETCKKRILEGHQLISEKTVPVTTLSKIFQKHASDREIDLLSVDVEGLDYDVLTTNNWSTVNPKCVLIEDHDFSFDRSSRIDTFLVSHGYKVVARTLRNSLYVKGYSQKND